MNLCDYTKISFPFERFEFNNCLSNLLIDEINKIINTFDIIDQDYNEGKRTDKKNRIFINKDLIEKNKYIYIQKMINSLLDKKNILFLEKIGNIDLSNCYLRIEITADKKNFWLEKHTDISEKKISFLIYINDNNQDLDIGTDIYDINRNYIHTIPFKHNFGYLFFPGKNTWHGLEKGKNIELRKCLIINYVSFKTEFKI